MPAWLAFLITLSLIILVHEWGHFAMARAIGVKVERFSFGFGPRLAAFRRGGTEYRVCLLPFGGYVKLAGEEAEDAPPAASRSWEYRSRSVWERMSIVAAGPAVNYLLGWLLFWAVFLAGAPVYTPRIGQVIEDYPAAEAGLKPADRILEVAGRPVETWEEMTRAIRAQTGPIPLRIEREGEVFSETLEPAWVTHRNVLGREVRTPMIGVTPSKETTLQRYGFGAAALKAGERVWFLTRVTLLALWRLATGGLSLKDSFTGPIGIFYITSSVAEQGWAPLLQFIAVLSVCIGLFNILPIPILDGGHLLFLAIERVRGRAVSVRVQEGFLKVGLAFLLLLLVAVTYNDFIRFDVARKFLEFIGVG